MERKLAAMVVAVAACATTTSLTNVQVAPETPREKFSKVLVIGLFKDPGARQAYETEMVKALQLAGVQAAASQPLLPIGEAPTREALERLVAERGFDSALVGRLIDSRTEVNAVPPSGPMYTGFYGYYGWAAPMAYSPGYLETTKTVVVETRAFRTASDGTAVFSATSDTVDPTSVKDASVALEGRGGRATQGWVRLTQSAETVLASTAGHGTERRGRGADPSPPSRNGDRTPSG